MSNKELMSLRLHVGSSILKINSRIVYCYIHVKIAFLFVIIYYFMRFPPLSSLRDVPANCSIVRGLLVEGRPNSFFMWLPSLHWWNNFATSSPQALLSVNYDAITCSDVSGRVWTCLDASGRV